MMLHVLLQVGRTEVIKDTLEPNFVKKFFIDYFFEERQLLTFAMWVLLIKNKYLLSFFCSPMDVFQAVTCVVLCSSSMKPNKASSSCMFLWLINCHCLEDVLCLSLLWMTCPVTQSEFCAVSTKKNIDYDRCSGIGPRRNCSQWPPTEKIGRDLCWIIPHVSPNNTKETELNWMCTCICT